MLTELRDYLRARPWADLSDIALHLGVTPDLARSMCEVWMAKGRLERIDATGHCGDCRSCDTDRAELYRWIGGR